MWEKTMSTVLNFYTDPEADCVGECDCCGKTGPLTKTIVLGIDTSACDVCRGECDLETRAKIIERLEAEITVLREAMATAKTLWVKAMLHDGIKDIRRRIEDLKEGNI
jgi:F420-0:gamma-glutamyl ligase